MVKFFRWPFWWPFWWPFCVVNLRAVGTFRVAVLVVNFPDLLGLYGSPNWGLFSRVVVAVGVAVQLSRSGSRSLWRVWFWVGFWRVGVGVAFPFPSGFPQDIHRLVDKRQLCTVTCG